MPAAETARQSPDEPVSRSGSLTLSKKIFGAFLTAALLALFVLAIRRAPPGALESLRHARPAPLLAGFAVFFASHVLRAARLNLLLPQEGRIPATRAFGLSGATHLLVQVVPFRGGDVASLGLVHRELGVSWSRSGGVFVLVKLIDTASAVLVGLAGGTVVLMRHRVAGGPWAAGLFCVLLVGLALLPEAGGALLEAFSTRARQGSRLKLGLEGIGRGLTVARRDRLAYAAACLLSAGFLAAHLVGLKLTMAGLGIDVGFAALAFATLAATLAAALVPSPAGTFGTAESGWTAALALDGISLGAGALSGVAVHLLATLAAGAAGLFVLSRPARR
ncbi:MAG TPA: lysylphosphatidylglycerol synthase transmembrane domain-containing protein [Thermoanaerobaculia bacterium]|nr:lysylphosphatidylglycerol synthase transmembrane domain-containing protein [Thermoanaerobaculia bacterium]